MRRNRHGEPNLQKLQTRARPAPTHRKSRLANLLAAKAARWGRETFKKTMQGKLRLKKKRGLMVRC
jgi:hypothetical protein